MLIPQYSTSRLIDRLVDEGLASRRECKIDKRGQFVEITEAGRELQKRMWGAYSAAIEKYVGSKLSDADAVKLSGLLDRLVDEGLAARRECKIDKRGQFVEITENGRELQKKMWNAYSAAIEKYVGSKLSDADAVKLCGLLDRLGCSCGDIKVAAARDGMPAR